MERCDSRVYLQLSIGFHIDCFETYVHLEDINCTISVTTITPALFATS